MSEPRNKSQMKRMAIQRGDGMNILEKLADLNKQATIEKSHFYVGSCVIAAINEIQSLQQQVTELTSERNKLKLGMIWQREQVSDDLVRLHRKIISSGGFPHSDNAYILLQSRLQAIQQALANKPEDK